jgi:hypothetical protein
MAPDSYSFIRRLLRIVCYISIIPHHVNMCFSIIFYISLIRYCIGINAGVYLAEYQAFYFYFIQRGWELCQFEVVVFVYPIVTIASMQFTHI